MTQRVRELEVTMCLAGLRPWSLGSLHVRSDVRDLCKESHVIEVISFKRVYYYWINSKAMAEGRKRVAFKRIFPDGETVRVVRESFVY